MSKNSFTIRLNSNVEEPNYAVILDKNKEHPLIKYSRELRRTIKSDQEHNTSLVAEGLTVHHGSRANNLMLPEEYLQLTRALPHSLAPFKGNFPMYGRPVRVDNLYQLKTGPRKGAYLGANVFNFSSYHPSMAAQQAYIATEAPYEVGDFYRMIIDTGSRIIVSLTTEEDVKPDSVHSIIRGGISVDIHHLYPQQKLLIDSCTVHHHSEHTLDIASMHPLTIKVLQVTTPTTSYLIHHFVFKGWTDYHLLNKYDIAIKFVQAIRNSQVALNAQPHHPITVNCGYGYGRTATLIAFDQIARLTLDAISLSPSLQRESECEVDVQTILYAIQEQIAYGALTGPKGEDPSKLRTFQEQANAIANQFLAYAKLEQLNANSSAVSYRHSIVHSTNKESGPSIM